MLKLTNELIKLYEKKVLFIANKYSNKSNFEDLYQAGMTGLLEASKNYNENLNTSFSTFSELYIKGEILDYIRKDKNIKVSRDYYRLKKKIDIVKSRMNKDPTIEELSYILNEPKDKIISVINTDQNVKSIEEPITEDLSLKDTISSKEEVDSLDLLCLKDALNELSKEDKKLIKERYYNGKTQTELAKEMNISQVKVYRLERRILNELENKLAS
ncbi:MAG: sigma-70 family RNA polymerase sigma factor [Bacilli bacterium]|nr:sigma-70 family RNA polymerase sigma factor [Bacilli bacterium]MBO6194931.1 sigma-70 family RNA polymerase sigma factor [Bacilli bacterium]